MVPYMPRCAFDRFHFDLEIGYVEMLDGLEKVIEMSTMISSSVHTLTTISEDESNRCHFHISNQQAGGRPENRVA